MSDARNELSPKQMKQLDEHSLELVRGSIIEKAVVRFLSQAMAEGYYVYQKRLSELEAENDYLRTQLEEQRNGKS